MLYTLTIYPTVKRTLKINISGCDKFAKKAKFEDSFNLAAVVEDVKPCVVKSISKELYNTLKDADMEKRNHIFKMLGNDFELYKKINEHFIGIYQKWFKKITEFAKPNFDDSNLKYSTSFELFYEIKLEKKFEESDIGKL